MAEWAVVEEGKKDNLVKRYTQYAQQAEKHIVLVGGSLYSAVSFPQETSELFSELEQKALAGCDVDIILDCIQFGTENHPLEILERKRKKPDKYAALNVFGNWKEPRYHRGIYIDGRTGLIETEQNEQNKWKDVLLVGKDVRNDPLIMAVFRYLNIEKQFQEEKRKDHLPVSSPNAFNYVREDQWRRANHQVNWDPPHKITNRTRFLNTQTERRKGLLKHLMSLRDKALRYNWLLPRAEDP